MTVEAYSKRPSECKPSIVEGWLILKLRDGKLTVYPVTNSDEETRELLAAVLDHISSATGSNLK